MRVGSCSLSWECVSVSAWAPQHLQDHALFSSSLCLSQHVGRLYFLSQDGCWSSTVAFLHINISGKKGLFLKCLFLRARKTLIRNLSLDFISCWHTSALCQQLAPGRKSPRLINALKLEIHLSGVWRLDRPTGLLGRNWIGRDWE